MEKLLDRTRLEKEKKRKRKKSLKNIEGKVKMLKTQRPVKYM